MKLSAAIRSNPLARIPDRIRDYRDLLEHEEDATRAAHILRAIETLADELKEDACSLALQVEKGWLP